MFFLFLRVYTSYTPAEYENVLVRCPITSPPGPPHQSSVEFRSDGFQTGFRRHACVRLVVVVVVPRETKYVIFPTKNVTTKYGIEASLRGHDCNRYDDVALFSNEIGRSRYISVRAYENVGKDVPAVSESARVDHLCRLRENDITLIVESRITFSFPLGHSSRTKNERIQARQIV